MYIIDCHTHIFPPDIIAERDRYREYDSWFDQLYANPRAPMANGDDLLKAMDQGGIDRAVTFGFSFADLALCHACNEYVLDTASRHGEYLIPFIQVPPRAGREAIREARHCLERGARGIGELMPDGQGFALTDFDLLTPLMRLAKEFEVPVLFHTAEPVGHIYAGKGEQGSQEAFALASRYPDNVIILAHWGGGLPFYELMPEVREALRNVYYDTAASLYLYEAGIFRYAAQWVPDKILFGTDYPLIGPRRFLRHIERADLEPATQRKVLGENAADLFC
ncbi:MAG: amidohydrolase family protein [Chloroflexota bacterium]|nr:amidohydrolase family protein [Chloroflexota bacterium]